MAPRIAADFNTMSMDPEERVYIAKDDSTRPDRRFAVGLMRPGLHIVLYDEEMEVEAKAEFDPRYGVWFGRPDWSTRRDVASVP